MNEELPVENIEEIVEEAVNEVVQERKFHPIQEELVDVMCAKTGSNDRSFFRVMVAYKFAEIATNMRATVEFAGTKGIPANMYALDLAPSGYSKNASMNLLEENIFRGFKDEFMLKTMRDATDKNLGKLATDYELMFGVLADDAIRKINKEYESLPKFLYSFGSSTPEGFKSMRAKLSMAGVGATSNVIDEIGSNLQGNQETMTVQLEAYDMGQSKQKLIKVDSNSDMRGSVPSNLFAFGTQSKLLDSGAVEKQFFDMLETGYARRFVVGFVENSVRDTEITAEEMYDIVTNPMTDSSLLKYDSYFKTLADESFLNKEIKMSKDVTIELMRYRLDCDKRANELKEHEEILKAVIKHSYWRALKIATSYAFVDKANEITMDVLDNAIALSEDGIRAFRQMLKREKPYEKLAKYITDVGKKITQVDLVEDLVFYRGSEQQKRELMNLAVAYGYNNNMIIKKTIKDGIEFLEGERLKEVDISQISCSWSTDIADGYKLATNSFDKLHQLVSGNGYHYCSHQFENGHRNKDNVIKGFDLLILDVDSGLHIDICKSLLKEYTYLIATTKRHTEQNNRFRIILPMSHKLSLTPDEYSKFMKNVFEWLPFDSDEQTKDISRKWQSHKGEYWYNFGKQIDVLPFIPDTPKESKQRDISNKYTGVEHLQRWFLMNYDEAEYGRNNMCRDYALALFDDGLSSDTIRHSLHDFNERLNNPLAVTELESTVMKTVIRKEVERERA